MSIEDTISVLDDNAYEPILQEDVECLNDDTRLSSFDEYQNEETRPEKFVFESSGSDLVSALDVAEYILKSLGPLSTIKLQKLVYYTQVWSLVWDEREMFPEKIEAWVNGPVVRKLYDFHRGMFTIDHIVISNIALLDKIRRETIDSVLEFYSTFSAQELVELSHNEEPWVKARRGLDDNERGGRIISSESMAEYYGSL